MIAGTFHRHRFLLAGLLLLAFALRLFRLDYQSIWWDEGISLHLATSGLGEIVRDRLNNIHPPLYFFILKGWLALVGVSPFTARYLSALASLGQVAVVFAAVRYWSGRRGLLPWIAAGFMLLSPLSVIYGQEIRVYAMLPLAYLAMLLPAERLLSGEKPPARLLLYLGLAEWIGLHLHYIALFGVAYIGLWGVIVLVRRRDAAGLRRWVATQALVLLASLPWLVAVAANWAIIQAEANAGTFTAEPVPLAYLFAQVWAFHLTGLAGALSSRLVQIGAAVAAALVVGLFAARLTAGGRRLAVIVRIAGHWLIPLLLALAVWSVRSFSHPRYVVMYAALFIPLAAFLIYPFRRRAERVASLALAVCLIGLSLWGLRRYFFDPEATKPDMRGVARYLETAAGTGDLIFIPDTDWSLPFAYDGPAAVLMPHLDESPHDVEAALSRALDCAGGEPCAQSIRVFLVDYPRGTRDWQGRLPFELERRGYWAGEMDFEGLVVRDYRLTDQQAPLSACDGPKVVQADARFGPLRLESAWIEQGAPADTAVTVALCWRVADSAAADHVATLVLRDPVTGERIAQTDTALVNGLGAPVPYWPAGETVVTYHQLPLPLGTPPIAADLALGVYTSGAAGANHLEALDESNNSLGQLLSLGDVALGLPVGLSPSPYETAAPPLWERPAEVTDGLRLLGARFSPGPYRPGQTIRVGLTWESTTDGLPGLRPALVLEQGGATLAENDEAPVNGRYPTDRWRAGQVVSEYRDVRAPAGAEGPAQLTVILGDERVELGQIAISGADVLFERPAVTTPIDVHFGADIALIGFDPPPETVDTAEDVPLTLYWQSLTDEIAIGYTVFVHLLAEDGRLIGQHDAPPANGQRPTDDWLAGEFIIDPHLIEWREPGYTGAARIAVGLYDPATGERLLTADGADSYVLPLVLRVAPAE